MSSGFIDNQSFGSYYVGANTESSEQKFMRQSELVLSSLRDVGLFDNIVVDSSPPSTNKIWLDNNFDPPILKKYDAPSSSWIAATFNNVFPSGGGGASNIQTGLPWTPVLSDALGNIPPHRAQLGRYDLIDNRVIFSWSLQLDAKTGLAAASHLKIGGLPVPVSSVDSSYRGGVHISYYLQVAMGAYYGMSAVPVIGQNHFLLYKTGNTGMATLTSNDVNATVSIHGFGVYLS